MGFDPDKYLASKEQKKPAGGFDPDAYLAEKEVPARDSFPGEGWVRGTLKALPAAGSMAGAFIGSGLGPAGTFGGGLLGAAGGRAVQNLGESLLGDEKTRDEVLMGPVREAAWEAGSMGVAGLLGAAKNGVKNVYRQATDRFYEMGAPAKEGAEQIMAAGERIGVSPTRGMTTSSPYVKDIESAMSQTPTQAGQKIRQGILDVEDGLKKAANEALDAGKTTLSKNQLAASAKKSISTSVQNQLKPAIDTFEDIAEHTKAINVFDVKPKDIESLGKNITIASKGSGGAGVGVIEKIQRQLSKATNIDEVRAIKNSIDSQIDSGRFSEEISKKLSKVSKEIGKLNNKISNPINRVATNISNLPYAKISGTPESSLANQVAGNLKKVRSLDELRNLRCYVGGQLNNQTLSPTMKHTVGEIYGRLTKLEHNSITRMAINSEQRKLAEEMIGNIKSANKIYGQVSKNVKELAKRSGLGHVKNYVDFLNKLDDVKDEKLVEKLFHPDNLRGVKEIQKQFPEAFDAMKKSRLAEIYTKSLTKGEVSIPKLLGKVKYMTPEMRDILFGDGANQKLKDIETVYNNIGKPVGPSGTPKGNLFLALNPFRAVHNWFDEIGAKANKYLLDHPEIMAKAKTAKDIRVLNKNMPIPTSQIRANAVKNRMGYGLLPRSTGLLINTNNNENGGY